MNRLHWCVTWLLFCHSVVLSQVTTGTISGAVKDQTGAVLPAVSVEIKNQETGIARTVLTDDAGRYRAPNLSLGDYDVRASLMGFKTEIRSGIRLTIGREAAVDFTLGLGEITEEVVVTGEASLVDTTGGSLGTVIDTTSLVELPLNRRDVSQLITLEAGVVTPTNALTNDLNSGFGRNISVSGARPTQNVFLMDGANANSFDDRVPAGIGGSFLGAEAIREFKVQTNAYSAELGRAGGGVFNVVTRTGTNQFHGSVFEFHRNDNLDAANFFDVEGKPEFKRNQYGFALGGPVVRNKTFFFTTYEGLRERLGVTQIDRTFTRAVRTGVIPNPVTGRTVTTTVDPRVRPYLDLWPLPNGPVLDYGDGSGDFTHSFSRPTDEDFWQLRIDHQWTDMDSFFARYNISNSNRETPEVFRLYKTIHQSRNQYVTLEEKKIFSSALVNTFRFGFTRSTPAEFEFQDPEPQLLKVPLFVPGVEQLGSIGVSPVSTIGSGSTLTKKWVNRFQYMDDVAYARGDHSLKFGVLWERVQFNGDNPARNAGDWSFGSIQDFFEVRPSRFRGAIVPGSNDAIRGVRQHIVGLYLQDDFRVTRRLTFNLGARYEFSTIPNEVNGKTANFVGDFYRATLADVRPGPMYGHNPAVGNVAPRLGFAWDFAGDGKTALRGGFGVFHDLIAPQKYQTSVFRVPPFLIEVQATQNVPFPNIYDLCLRSDPRCTGRPAPDVWNPNNLRNPYLMQWNLNLQRQVLAGTVVTAGYAGSRGVGLFVVEDINVPAGQVVNGRLFFSPQLRRPNPNFDDIRYRTSGAGSWYHSFQANVRKRFSAGLAVTGSYTVAKSLDEASGNQTASDFVTDPQWVPYFHNIRLNRGRSAFDVRQAFSLSYIYQLPAPSRQGWTGQLMSGWQVGGIVQAAAGVPGTVKITARRTNIGLRVDFPDLRAGANHDAVLGGPDKYFDPGAYQFPPTDVFGNLGRNTLTLPGVATVDFSLSKNTRVPALGEEGNLQFRAEFFNLFNRANFGGPVLTVFDRRGNPIPSAGRITNTTTSSRQVQFGLKLVF